MHRRRSRRTLARFIGLLAVAGAALAVAATFTSLASGPAADGPLSVAVSPVGLDPARPALDRVGPLRYRGGLWLRSDDPRFGGLSDLRLSADGRELRAISDCGYGFTARLAYDGEGRLADLGEPRLVELLDPQGEPLKAGERDSESLVVRGESIEVGFEGRPRVWGYELQPPFAGPARPVPTPAGLASCGSNASLETMTMVDATRRLLVCEGRRGASLDVPAWLGDGDAWAARSYPLLFRDGWAGEPFRPTGAALLPDGDVVVVERRFPPIATRVVRLARADVLGEGALHPVEIATIESPLIADNFEGIEARRDEAGRTLLYLLSDDNHCAKTPGGSRGTGLQRTLLLMFSLED